MERLLLLYTHIRLSSLLAAMVAHSRRADLHAQPPLTRAEGGAAQRKEVRVLFNATAHIAAGRAEHPRSAFLLALRICQKALMDGIDLQGSCAHRQGAQ